MPLNLKCSLFLLAGILHMAALRADGEEIVYGSDSVAVVANTGMPGSMKVARAYMKMRQIPAQNLIKINAPTNERVSRDEYLREIHNPILKTLLSRELVDAFEGPVDELGRKTVTIYKNKIRYMVLCYGVPSKIGKASAEVLEKDEALLKSYFLLRNAQYIKTFSEGRMARDDASVDGELSLLLTRGTPLRGFVPNPLHRSLDRSANDDILRVTRLDGPSANSVIGMLESTMRGERDGLRGRAYVDEDGRRGGFEIGNMWMASTAELFRSMGFDTSHNTARSTFAMSDRFDAPVLYGGWYAWNCEGPFNLPGFRFPDGAVAAHLHSASAASIRSPTKGWVGPFVEKGVACTFGNVGEPYLRLTHQFDAFFKALSDGWNFADAAYYALPGLSWQAVAVGDPLYRPFAITLEDQLEEREPSGFLMDQYVIIRKANLLQQAGNREETDEFISSEMCDHSSPALALWCARYYADQQDVERALESLRFVRGMKPAGSDQWGLLADIADTLVEWGDSESALQVYLTLEKVDMPPDLKLAFMKRGAKVATEAGNAVLASKWKPEPVPVDENK